jgi:hypothetical protein
MLKDHGLVEGIPRQRLDGVRSLIEIPLTTGEQLVFDKDERQFSIESRS